MFRLYKIQCEDSIKPSLTLGNVEQRALRIITAWIEQALLRKVSQCIDQAPTAPVMCMYSSDGWTAFTTVRTSSLCGPHVRVDNRGRVRLEFCLERAVVRQLRPSGKTIVMVMARMPLGMNTGRRHGNFFTAAVHFMPTLADLGARGVKIQMFSLDGLHYSSFMRIMRGRFALRCSGGEHFHDELDRLLFWVHEWVIGNKCKSHACSNAVVWSLKRYSTGQLQEDCHIAIKSLRNTSGDLVSMLGCFISTRAAGVVRYADAAHVETFWKFCLISEDLLPFFIAADPFWDGDILQINAEFMQRNGAVDLLTTMMLHVLTWSDWSETRWCAVKYAARRLIRSVVCGVSKLADLVKKDRDIASHYINGFDRLTEEVRFYLCLAACSSAPIEKVLKKLLADDRFARFCGEMRADMVDHLACICGYPPLLWQRLCQFVGRGDGRSWHMIRSECIRAAVIGCAYLQRNGFAVMEEAPWKYTQGDISQHVDRIRTSNIADLPKDETTMKIAVGLANGVHPEVFVQALLLLKDASMTSNMNERAHGYGARLVAAHGSYGYATLARRSLVNSCHPLFHATGLQKRIERLEQKLARLERLCPQRASAAAMHFKDAARQERTTGSLHDGCDSVFEKMQVVMKYAGQKWVALTAAERQVYLAARDDHVDERHRIVADTKRDLLSDIMALRAEAAEEIRLAGIPNLMSTVEKFTNEEMNHLAELLMSNGSDPKDAGCNDFASPLEPSVAEMNSLERLNGTLHPQGDDFVKMPWFVEFVAAHREEWYTAAMFDPDVDPGLIYVFLFASQSPRLAWFLECREQAHVISDGRGRTDGEDITGDYREFEFLAPLQLVPDHRVKVGENVRVYTDSVFRGPLLCTFSPSISFDDFVEHHGEVASTKTAKEGPPRKRVARDHIEKLLEAYPWLSREDFDESAARSYARQRGRKSGGGGGGDDGGGGADVELPLDMSDYDVFNEGPDAEIASVPVVDVATELAIVRDEVAHIVGAFDPVDFFRVVTRGGNWTFQNRGTVADSSRGEARGDLVKAWCRKYEWPLSMTFAFVRFGQAGSSLLAKEYCRRGSFFFTLCYTSVDPESYVYSLETAASCIDDFAFLDYVLGLELEDHGFTRAQDIRQLSPRIG